MFIISYLLQLILICQSKEHTMPQVCALATSKVIRDPRLGLPSCPGPRTSPLRSGGLWAALLHATALPWSYPEGLPKACAPHPLPWAPTGLCSCPAAPVPWKGFGNGSLASRVCVCVWTQTHQYRQEWSGGKASLYREGEQRRCWQCSTHR